MGSSGNDVGASCFGKCLVDAKSVARFGSSEFSRSERDPGHSREDAMRTAIVAKPRRVSILKWLEPKWLYGMATDLLEKIDLKSGTQSTLFVPDF